MKARSSTFMFFLRLACTLMLRGYINPLLYIESNLSLKASSFSSTLLTCYALSPSGMYSLNLYCLLLSLGPFLTRPVKVSFLSLSFAICFVLTPSSILLSFSSKSAFIFLRLVSSLLASFCFSLFKAASWASLFFLLRCLTWIVGS